MDARDTNQFKTMESDYTINEDDSLVKFIAPATMLLVGQSSSGKTRYMQKLVQHGEGMFSIAPSRYIWLYNIYQDIYDEIEASVPNLSFVQGIPSRPEVEAWAKDERHLVIIADDVYHLIIESKDLLDVFILLSHHMTLSLIISCHNVFQQSKYAKTMTTNLHYILLFKLQNRLQLSTLGTQLFCHNKKAKNFVQVYDAVMAADQYSPLVIDLSPKSRWDNKLRTHILPGQWPIIFELE